MIGYRAAMKKCSFGVLVFSGLVSLGLLLSSSSMLYALDSNNTDEGSASNVAIASVESAIDAQRESTFAAEQNSQVDNETLLRLRIKLFGIKDGYRPKRGLVSGVGACLTEQSLFLLGDI